MRVEIEISPSFREIKAAMRVLEGDLKDWRAVWRQLLPIVAAETGRSIKSEGSNLGVSWPALKQATIRKKAQSGRGRAMLVGTGKLLKLVSSRRGKRSLTKTQLVFGIGSGAKKYMFVHHYGSDKLNLPSRKYMGITPRIERSAEILMQRHANKVLAAAARRFNG